jgi:hypothetical protein
MADADSEDKRRSAINMPPFVVAPVPDGTIDANDRIQATWWYSGLGAQTPVYAQATRFLLLKMT